eukprot:3087630-Rhodomonas_salina.3
MSSTIGECRPKCHVSHVSVGHLNAHHEEARGKIGWIPPRAPTAGEIDFKRRGEARKGKSQRQSWTSQSTFFVGRKGECYLRLTEEGGAPTRQALLAWEAGSQALRQRQTFGGKCLGHNAKPTLTEARF